MGRRQFLIVTLFLFLLGCSYGYVFIHGFSAREKPLWLEAFIAGKLRHLAVPAAQRHKVNPLSVDELTIAEARDHFADHCAVCHANNGSGKTAINSGLYPPAPDLRESGTQKLSDGEIFWIIKNGVRFTGMPGWGGGDQENWALVAFIRHMPTLNERELTFMKQVNQLEE